MKTTTVRKWGNSIAVRLPKDSAQKLGLHEGTTIEFVEDEKTRSLSIRSLSSDEYILSDFVSRITSQNKHGEVRWGKASGKEVW